MQELIRAILSALVDNPEYIEIGEVRGQPGKFKEAI